MTVSARRPEDSEEKRASLHGGNGARGGSAEAREAFRRARDFLANGALAQLITGPRDGSARERTGGKPALERARQVYVHRNLRMDKIDLVGFDMDYTLAIYHLRRLEKLSYDMTIERLVASYGYPAAIRSIPYDHEFVLRGLFVDKAHGNLLKMDRFGYVGRAYHGRRRLSEDTCKRLYRDERVLAKSSRYAWIDTLFALPEACLYAGIIDLFESEGQPTDYGKLYDDIREAIDTVHRDDSLKNEIRKDIGHYIFKDPELGPALHKLRSAGKKLFLLTNSLWSYTDAVMRYLFDGVLTEYPSWRNYFDFVITGAGKPGFFGTGSPFLEVDSDSAEGSLLGERTTLERGRVYQGGSLAGFEKATGFRGDAVLYVGDHIFGDILKSKKSSLWRTCMVVQELEDEINYTDTRAEEIACLAELERLRDRLEDEVGQRKSAINGLERRLDKEELSPEQRSDLEQTRKQVKSELERLRRALKDADGWANTLEQDVEHGFNPHWGLMFKEGNENSRFGEQVERYACIYTSRVSNLLHYSPLQYFRSPREFMPHESAGALSGLLSAMGSEGPPAGSEGGA